MLNGKVEAPHDLFSRILRSVTFGYLFQPLFQSGHDVEQNA